MKKIIKQENNSGIVKRNWILIGALIVFCMIVFQSINVLVKYDLNALEYIKYSMPLSNVEKAYLDNNKIFYDMDTMSAPLSFIDKETNQNSGIIIDYISQLSVNLGKDIQIVPTEKVYIEQNLKNLENHIASIYKTNTNYEDYNFTQMLYVMHGKILVKNSSNFDSLEDLQDAKLAIVRGDVLEQSAKNYFEEEDNVTLVLTDNINQSIELMDKGAVDGVAADETKISYILNEIEPKNSYKLLKHALYREELCFVVADNNEVLKKILNKEILTLKKKNLILQTQNKWFGAFKPDVKDMNEYDKIYKIIFGILTIIVVFSIWNISIVRKVDEKTEEIRKSKEKLRAIIDTLSAGLLVIGDDDEILECNNEMTKILQMRREQILNKKISEIEPLKLFITDLNNENTLIKGNAYYRVIKQQYKGFENQSLISIVDITEKHINELRARQETKMIAVGQLLAGLAHEIRNPLGLIKSYSFVLNKYCDSKMEEYALSVINDSVGRINRLIENLLNFSRLANDEHKIVNIKTLVENIISLEYKNISQKGIEIEIKYADENSYEIKTNEDIIRLTLLNLLNNSIDAFEGLDVDNKNITIDITISENNLKIDIMDNGSGIKKKDIENIFNPFYTTKESGSGLGLYIISSELAKIDGKISVESEKEIGTIFHIVVPVERNCDE